MPGPDDIRQLTEMAAKARRLARPTNDPITIDVLTHYASECDDQVEKLRATVPTEDQVSNSKR